jgi:polyisoprenoid-binding protein YceI
MTDATPTSRRRWIPIAALLLLLAAIGIGGYLAWDQFLRGDDVAPIGFSSPSPTTSASPAASGSTSASSPEPTTDPSDSPAPSAAGSAGSAATLAGTWTVTDGSVVGYRVREQLGPVAAQTDAVGRTEAVTGSATIVAAGDALQVTDASFEADVSTLTSDDGRRDNRIRSIGLESSSFPSATFVLVGPVDVPAEATGASTVQVTLAGDLTVHGVTKSVSLPAEARLADGTIEIVGSLTFPFSDFGMTPPNIGGFVTVADDATLEFRIVLAKG